MSCTFCPLLFCDFASKECRLTAAEVVRTRPDLIRPLTKHQRYYYANKDKYREWNKKACKRYLANNRARRLETERNWRANHKETIAAGQRSWWAKNKSRINAERRERRAVGK